MSVKKSYNSEYLGGILGRPIQSLNGIVFQKNGKIRQGPIAKKKKRKNVIKHK